MRPWISVVAAIGVGVLTCGVSVVRADTSKETAAARENTRRGEAAYNLGHYSEAATEFEAAYRLLLDPALLFNVAQSWRLANQPEKALTIYRSYLRTAPANASKREEAQRWQDELERKLAVPKEPAGAPRTTTPMPAPPPPTAAPPPPAAAPPPPAPPTPAPSVSTPAQPPAVTVAPAPPVGSPSPVVTLTTPGASPPPAAERPVYKRWWFWVIVGAAAAGAATAAIMLSADGQNPDCLGISPCGTF